MPPSRTHLFSTPYYLFLLALVAVIIAVAAAASITTAVTVTGIDFGAENIKIGLARPAAPIDIVLNEQSKRKTPSTVTFRDDRDRYFGEAAKTLETRFPASSLKSPVELLGQRYSNTNTNTSNTATRETSSNDPLHRFLHRYQQEWHIPVRFVRNRDRGEVLDAVLQYGNNNNNQQQQQQLRFSLEELSAMVFKYVRDLVEKAIGTNDASAASMVKDCVITIPAYFSEQQRRSILDSARLAGFNVLSLMHDTTAAVLQYAVTNYKQLHDVKEDKPRRIAIVDMGTASTRAVVAELMGPSSTSAAAKKQQQQQKRVSASLPEIGRVVIKGVSWDKMLGGRDFEARIADHFAAHFDSKFKPANSVRANARAMARMMQQAQKTKEVLSANTETFFSVESVHDDRDLRAAITRAEFEEMCDDLIERFLEPLRAAVEQSGLELQQIDSLEVIGGATRIPVLQKRLREYFGRDISFSLNSDESVALGATFKGAMLSPYFRVKGISVTDVAPYQIDFMLQQQQNDEQQQQKVLTLFNAGDRIGERKSVNIPRTEDFSLVLRYGHNNVPESYLAVAGNIEEVRIKGVVAAMANLTAVLQEERNAAANAAANNPAAAPLSEEEQAAKTKVRVSFELDHNGMLKLVAAQATLERMARVAVVPATPKKKNDTDDVAQPIAIKYKKEKRVSRVDLSVERVSLSNLKPLSDEAFAATKSKLQLMDTYDARKSELARLRNSLESQLYNIRSSFLEDEDIAPFYNEQQKQELLQLLDTLDVWAENEGQETTETQGIEEGIQWFDKMIAVFEEKLTSIDKLVGPIQDRREHKAALETALTSCAATLNRTRVQVSGLEKTHGHVTQEERQELTTLIDETEQFLTRTKQQLQELVAQSKLHDALPVGVEDVKMQCSKSTFKLTVLRAKPKPKPQQSTTSSSATDNTTAQEPANKTEEQKKEDSKDEL